LLISKEREGELEKQLESVEVASESVSHQQKKYKKIKEERD